MPDFDRSRTPATAPPTSDTGSEQHVPPTGAQDTVGNAEVQRRLTASQGLSKVDMERLRAVASILRYEDNNGTWKTITNYNAFTGDIPGRNIWVQLKDGTTADLCWMFDVALVAGGVGGTTSQVLGSVGGRLGEGVGAVLGQSVGGLAYWGGRLVGAAAEGFESGSVDAFTGYMRGSLNEDNISGANMALKLSWANSFGGAGMTIRELIHPRVIQQVTDLGL